MSTLATAFQRAMERSAPTHVIPLITHPLGKHWEQPDRFQILIDDTHAVMGLATFKALHEYSCSMPTGVYPGKMWRCDLQAYRDPRLPKLPENQRHVLRWYGDHPNPELVSNHQRTILIV